MKWLMGLFGRKPTPKPPTQHERELDQQVTALEGRSKRAVDRASAVLNSELIATYQTILAHDRRRRDRGHTPDRRAHHG